jgi:hypothetical protein
MRGGGLTYAAVRPADDLAGLEQLAHRLGVGELWIVGAEAQQPLTRLQIAGGGAVIMGSRALGAASSADPAAIEAAVRGLLCNGCSLAPVRPPLSRARVRAALSLGALALAGMVTSWGLWGAHRQLEQQLSDLPIDDPAYADKLTKRERLDRAATATTSVGAALVVAASITGLPVRRPDAWSPAMIATMSSLSAAGLALIAGGAVVLSQHDQLVSTTCPDDVECLRRRAVVPLGPMLLTQGLGLLSIPLTYSLRALPPRRASVGLQAWSDGFVASLRSAL